MRFIIILTIYFVGGAVSFHEFTWAACLFLWNNIFQPLEISYHAGTFPVAQYVFCILILSYFSSVSRGILQPRTNPMVTMAAIFLGWLCLCSLISPFQDTVWKEYWEILKYLLPLILISSGLVNFRSSAIVAFTIMVSVGLWSAQAGVKGLVNGMTSSMAIRGGQMSDNNDFMAVTIGILPLLMYFSCFYKWKYPTVVRGVLLLMLFLTLAAVIFSHSRGAVIGLLSIAVGYVIFCSTHKLRDGMLIIILLGGIGLILPNEFWQRMQTIDISVTKQAEASAANRLKMMKAAWSCSLDYPVFGVGPNSWLEISEEYAGEQTEPHSIYLKLASEVGFPGLLIFLSLIFGTIARLLKLRQGLLRERCYLDEANFSLALALGIIGTATSLTFLNHPYSEFLWAMLGIANAHIINMQCENLNERTSNSLKNEKMSNI